jgi:hypothetical protein
VGLWWWDYVKYIEILKGDGDINITNGEIRVVLSVSPIVIVIMYYLFAPESFEIRLSLGDFLEENVINLKLLQFSSEKVKCVFY